MMKALTNSCSKLNWMVEVLGAGAFVLLAASKLRANLLASLTESCSRLDLDPLQLHAKALNISRAAQ